MRAPHIFTFVILVACLHGALPQTSGQSLPVAETKQSCILNTDGNREILFDQPGSPNIVQATTHDGKHVDVSFNKDATEIRLALPKNVSSDQIRIRTAEESTQYSDGTIVFSALDAKVHGERAKLESHPGSHRIGFWSNESDYVTWAFKPKRWGRYDVELLYSQAGPSGNEVYATFSSAEVMEPEFSETMRANLESTGSWYTYRVAKLGRLYIDDQSFRSQLIVKVGSKKKVANAVMNLKAILLRPACEETELIKADDNGELLFHSKDSTVCGVQLVYEPNPKKNTLGWWVVPTDKARWSFTVGKPGKFAVVVQQGCGEGQGGSKVAVEVLDENAPVICETESEWDKWTNAETEFEVEDTGHFQNYKLRSVGELKLKAGNYILQVRPRSIAKNAVMDLRKLSLKSLDQN